MTYQYLILDSRGNAVAHGVSQQDPAQKTWCLLVKDGDIDRVMSHTYVSLVGSAENVPGLEGRIVRRDGNRVYLEPIRPLGEDVRKNLRIPVRFVSYLYPVSGRWKGRVPIISKDLSCGGLAFYCPRPLEVDERGGGGDPRHRPARWCCPSGSCGPRPIPTARTPMPAALQAWCGKKRAWCGKPCSASSCKITEQGKPCV